MAAVAFTGQAFAQESLSLKTLRYGVHADKTRIVIELNKETDFRVFMEGGKDYTLIVDVPTLKWDSVQYKKPQKPIVSAGVSHKNPSVSRLVFKMKDTNFVRSAFMIPASKKAPAKLVVDISPCDLKTFNAKKSIIHGTLKTMEKIKLPFAGNKTEPLVANKTASTPKKSPIDAIVEKIVEEEKKAPKKQKPSKKYTVMIDPGHGGVDPGAIGGRIKEKNITLSMAKTLKKTLEKTGRYNVYLTRKNDVYLKLHQRVALARYKEADLFISIHADSIGKKNVSGASVYTISDKASDKETAKLAARENQSDLISGVDLSTEDKDVASILIDLSIRETTNQSKFFANNVVRAMQDKKLKMLQNPHRYAGFAVLKAPDIPSVLIEIGFVSNEAEARRLMDKKHQERLSSAILRGIERYFATLEKNHKAQ